MSLITTHRTAATRATTTFGQIHPRQKFWTGDQWNVALEIHDYPDDPDLVRILHRPDSGPAYATPYRRGRLTSILLDTRTPDHH